MPLPILGFFLLPLLSVPHNEADEVFPSDLVHKSLLVGSFHLGSKSQSLPRLSDLPVKLFILADVGNPQGPAHTTVSPLILLVSPLSQSGFAD